MLPDGCKRVPSEILLRQHLSKPIHLLRNHSPSSFCVGGAAGKVLGSVRRVPLCPILLRRQRGLEVLEIGRQRIGLFAIPSLLCCLANLLALFNSWDESFSLPHVRDMRWSCLSTRFSFLLVTLACPEPFPPWTPCLPVVASERRLVSRWMLARGRVRGAMTACAILRLSIRARLQEEVAVTRWS